MESHQISLPIQPGSGIAVIRGMLGHMRLIVACVAIFAIAAVVISMLLPPRYEASATLLLMPSPFREVVDKDKQQLGLFPRILSVKDYAVLLMSDGVLKKVADRVGKEGGVLGDLTRLSRLRNALSVVTTVADKTAYASTYSPAIILQASGRTPEIAQALAQTWAVVAVDEAESFFKIGKGPQVEFLTERLQAARAELDRMLAEAETNEALFDPDAAKQRLTDMTFLLSDLEDRHIQTQADMEAARGEVADLKAQLNELQPKVVLQQSPPDTALYLENRLGAKEPPKAGGAGEMRGYQTEEVNPTYTTAADFLVESQKTLKGLEEKERSLASGIEQVRKEIEKDRADFAKYNRDRKRLDKDFLVYSTNYGDIGSRLTQAQIAETKQENLADIKIAAQAVLPDEKAGPRRTYLVFTGAILGGCFGCVLALFRVIRQSPALA